jgi:hypothetical protein
VKHTGHAYAASGSGALGTGGGVRLRASGSGSLGSGRISMSGASGDVRRRFAAGGSSSRSDIRRGRREASSSSCSVPSQVSCDGVCDIGGPGGGARDGPGAGLLERDLASHRCSTRGARAVVGAGSG